MGNIDNYRVQMDTTPLFFSPQLVQEDKAFISTDPSNSDTELDVSNLLHGKTYYWRVRTSDGGNFSQWSDTWSFTVSDNGVSVNDIAAQQGTFDIYPNPITNASIIEFSVPKTSSADLRVYDITGREVAVLVQQQDVVGTNRYNLGEFDWKPGIYLARLRINNDIRVSKFLVK